MINLQILSVKPGKHHIKDTNLQNKTDLHELKTTEKYFLLTSQQSLKSTLKRKIEMLTETYCYMSEILCLKTYCYIFDL